MKNSKSVFFSKRVEGFDYKSINGDVYNLTVIGASLKQGPKGQYMHVTAKNVDNPLMPSVRCIFPSSKEALWKYNSFCLSAGYKNEEKVKDSDDLVGKKFSAKLEVHDNPQGDTKFIDGLQYIS